MAVAQRIATGAHAIAVLGVVAAAFAWAATVDYVPLTVIVDLMALTLAGVCWQARRRGMLGPTGNGIAAWVLRIGGYLLAAGLVLTCITRLRPSAENNAGPLVVALVAACYLVGLATAFGRGSAATARALVTAAGFGLAAAAVWLAGVLIAQTIPASIGPALALMAVAAAVTSVRNRDGALLPALVAAITAAALIVVLVWILAAYSPAGLIPDLHPHALTPAARVAESRIEIHDPYVGLAFLSALLATVLSVAGLVTRRPAAARPVSAAAVTA
jgi:hypothetical protein